MDSSASDYTSLQTKFATFIYLRALSCRSGLSRALQTAQRARQSGPQLTAGVMPSSMRAPSIASRNVFIMIVMIVACTSRHSPRIRPETPTTVLERSGCYDLRFVPQVAWEHTPQLPSRIQLLPEAPGPSDSADHEFYSLCLHMVRSRAEILSTRQFADGCWEPQGADELHLKWESAYGSWNLYLVSVAKAPEALRHTAFEGFEGH